MGEGTCRPEQCRRSIFLTSANSSTPNPRGFGFGGLTLFGLVAFSSP